MEQSYALIFEKLVARGVCFENQVKKGSLKHLYSHYLK